MGFQVIPVVRVQTTDRSVNGEETIKSLVKKINSNSDKIKGYTNAIQFVLTDADPYWIKISDGKIEKVEKANKKNEAVVTVTCTSSVLQKILDKELGSVMALVTRKVSVDGSILAIRELRQKILG